jgi:predicted DNA-binding transcriptional regulator AlpA
MEESMIKADEPLPDELRGLELAWGIIANVSGGDWSELSQVQAHQDAASKAVEKYLTTPEVAELCRAAPETVRYWRHIGYGPRSFKVGRRVLYDAEDVRTWLASLKAEQLRAAS